MENPSAIMKWQMDSINVKLLCQQSLHSLTIVATTETVFKRTENSFLKNLKRCRRSARNQTNVLINRTGFHDNNGADVEGESSLRRFSFNLLIVECELDMLPRSSMVDYWFMIRLRSFLHVGKVSK